MCLANREVKQRSAWLVAGWRRGSPSAGEWRLISGERQLFRIPADQISSKHRTRSERRSPSGTRSDHRSPPRRRDDHRQPSVRSESKRGRSSPPRQRHGNSPTRQKQRKRNRHHRGHGPSHNSELSSRLSDRLGTCDPCRGDYTALKMRHNRVGAHQEQSERPRRTPRSATTTHPRDETPTARLVEVSSGGSMKIHVDPVHSVDVGRQLVYHPQHYQVQHRHRIPDAFDACCHYFQLLIEVGLHSGVHPPEAFACAQPEPGYEVNMKSAVLVFNDPFMFPSQEEIRRLRDLGYCIVLGVKPKVRVTAAHLDTLANLLLMPQVAALGEIGVDHTAPCGEWAKQTSDAVRLFQCMPRGQQRSKVLVVKCQGMLGQDPSDAFDVLRTTLHMHVPGTQLVHFTCFTGDHHVVEKWLKSFPQTYFGFSKRVNTFEECQKDALRRMDESRILLETYSPYIKFGSRKPSTPAQLGMTAEAVARIRGAMYMGRGLGQRYP